MTNVEKFLERVKTDRDIQMKLKAAEKNYSGDRNDREAMAEAILLPAAKAAELPFTLNDLKAYEKKFAAKPDGTELSEKELKAVAGGMGCVVFSIADGGSEGFCFIGGESIGGDSSCIIVGF